MSTIEYTGLIVTTVELKTEKDGVPITSPQDNDGKTVYFTGNSSNGSKAYFLTNIKGTRTGFRRWEYTATIVSPAKASEIVADGFGNGKETIPLFCIHGASVQINSKLDAAEEAVYNFKEAGTYYPVPVIWPAGLPGIGYIPDRNSSEEAGELFRCFVECIPRDQFPRKSLMMHSMGNFLVHSGKDGNPLDVQFDNIFMVAADIPADIFSDDPRNEDDKEKAVNWKELLGKNGGKIFVFYATNDLLLIASPILNRLMPRIGLRGTTGNTCDEFSDVVENVNATENVGEGPLNHSYQYEKWTIQQYNELPTKK
eukprot:CAMPEP_0170927662 /NCGR_PEP_ID=MMETSP0735-20130129/13643_1 /TAXON_ID=186038 /ORGANISM="Fragilariopsis kerguelensis, Strain L26-C5" /LENGTH=311 /DNA_ID=CAMNT_0011328237 /DNA_START=93 /DNA_END=1028 /DNA_ORIENTATION=-